MGTIQMVSVAQVLKGRKTIKPSVNEVRFTSLAQPLRGLSWLARGGR